MVQVLPMAGVCVNCPGCLWLLSGGSGDGSQGPSFLRSWPCPPSSALYQGCHHKLGGGPASLAEFSLLALCVEGREVFIALIGAASPLKPWQPSESPWQWEVGVVVV